MHDLAMGYNFIKLCSTSDTMSEDSPRLMISSS